MPRTYKADEGFAEAQRRIERATRNSAKTIDLSGLTLSLLPNSLRNLSGLTELYLSGNRLASIPDWLGDFSALAALELGGNQFTSVPDSLRNLTSLGAIELGHNQLYALPDWLGELTNLTRLWLSGNRLASLPDSLRNLSGLTDLRISGNQLTSLPDWLGYISGLTVLRLGDNSLTFLPNSLGNLTCLTDLGLGGNRLASIPDEIGNLSILTELRVNRNQLTSIPDSLGDLASLRYLNLRENKVAELPTSIGNLSCLTELYLHDNQLASLPDSLGRLTKLAYLNVSGNRLSSLPDSLGNLAGLVGLRMDGNPLEPELAVAYRQGVGAVKRYLRKLAESYVVLNEAKLMLVGEGKVGKTCLLDALRGDPWQEHETTHGIDIRQIPIAVPDGGAELTLNAWDFGGQQVYRPTHQLFFTQPALYLVVWEPREGPQQGLVREWMELVRLRAPDARMLVVATHGGPDDRKPDINRQDLWDDFGHDMVLGFFHVDSKPDSIAGMRRGIPELRDAIARVAARLPGVGRKVPTEWQKFKEALQSSGPPCLQHDTAVAACAERGISSTDAEQYLGLADQLGHLIYYQDDDPALRGTVILKPDWLTTAISFVLDDGLTRDNHGLVSMDRLNYLWNNPAKEPEQRYNKDLHPMFLRLMERFDLCYRVKQDQPGDTSLVAQLVDDERPVSKLEHAWPSALSRGDTEQTQVCRIVMEDEYGKERPKPATGLMYQLIVRLHKYSLGRDNYANSVHWQRGLVLRDEYQSLARLEQEGNDIRIRVRAPYPERFLSVLTSEVKWLVESYWKGLRCNVMVPCIVPCGRSNPGTGLYSVPRLIESRKESERYPCPDCGRWQSIDSLLRNAPDARVVPLDELLVQQFAGLHVTIAAMVGRLAALEQGDKAILSMLDDGFTRLIKLYSDEAREGPRLFSFRPVDPGFLDKPKWMAAKFRLTLWCEHSRLPVTAHNRPCDRNGVYDIELPRDWLVKSAPYLQILSGALGLAFPVAAAGIGLTIGSEAVKDVEEELGFVRSCAEKLAELGKATAEWADSTGDRRDQPHGPKRAEGADLARLHQILKAKDPGFGGLVRVRNKQDEYLWVHSKFKSEYQT